MKKNCIDILAAMKGIAYSKGSSRHYILEKIEHILLKICLTKNDFKYEEGEVYMQSIFS